MKLIPSFENNFYNNILKSISISIIDKNENEISIETTIDHPIEIIIHRDSDLIIPAMMFIDVISIPHNQMFHLHYVNITNTRSISIHIQIQPLITNLSYLFIYKYDQIPQLNNQIDGWTLFCPLTNESIYTYFIDNNHIKGHHSIIFGIRELNSTEMIDYCFKNASLNNFSVISEQSYFTSNYLLNLYIRLLLS
jgi:hypothetical protein